MKKALDAYFGGGSGSSLTSGFANLSMSNPTTGLGIPSSTHAPGSIGALSNQATYGNSQPSSIRAQNSNFGSANSGLSGSFSTATFLQGDINMNDPAVLRKKIAELEAENKRLKESEGGSGNLGSKGFATVGK